jgi:dTDP-4-amino-4,6-dideoxygalactose transaminase
MTIPFIDLKAQYESIKSEIDDAVLGVLASGRYVLGPEVEKFEHEFATFQQTAHGVGVNSGTSALHLALLAAGIGPGDEVITVSMTFFATTAAILYAQATPVFVDVDAKTCTLDTTQIESRITPRTKAIIPVHLYGQCADMDPILAIAARHNLIVIEDAAQAHGAEYKGRRAGSMGAIGIFSFYPGKNLGACGEGGIAVTSDSGLARKMRILRDWGQETKYYHDVLSFNYRMDAIQGAILGVKLRHLEKWTEARRAVARAYDRSLRVEGIRFNEEAQDRRHVYHIYSVFHAQRDELQRRLLAQGIHTGIHYPVPIHLQRAYQSQFPAALVLPETERIAAEQLSLPMFAELSADQARHVGEAVAAVVGTFASAH